MLENFAYLTSRILAQALEQQYEDYTQEKDRLEHKLAKVQRRAAQKNALIELAQQAENVLTKWEGMSLIEKRAFVQIFIERIVVTQTEKYRVADVEIHWCDESVDKAVLPWSAKTWTLWVPE